MGTYIIHFDDKPWEDLDDELYYRCFEIPWFSTTKTTISRLTPYTEDSAYAHGYTEAESKYREIRDELEKQAYQRGMDDANRNGEYNADDGWYVMQKISLLPNPIKTELFGTAETAVILQGNSFKDALAKLTEYEQEKEEIQVGDEVIATSGKAVVIEVIDDGQTVRYMYPDTITGRNKACNVTRTGRHFPEIAEVLQKMKEANNG